MSISNTLILALLLWMLLYITPFIIPFILHIKYMNRLASTLFGFLMVCMFGWYGAAFYIMFALMFNDEL